MTEIKITAEKNEKKNYVVSYEAETNFTDVDLSSPKELIILRTMLGIVINDLDKVINKCTQ